MTLYCCFDEEERGETSTWIITQDGKHLIKCDYIEVRNNVIFGWNRWRHNGYKLGEYMSESEAEYAFHRLCAAIANGDKVYGMPDKGFWQLIDCCECGISIDRLQEPFFYRNFESYYCENCWRSNLQNDTIKPTSRVYVEIEEEEAGANGL